MQHLPRDPRGFPIPAWATTGPRYFGWWIRERRCWICDGVLRERRAFIVKPAEVITMTAKDPPAHVECAEYSFRTDRSFGLLAMVITNRSNWFWQDDRILFKIDEVTSKPRVIWWFRGRPASREEVEEAIDAALPLARIIRKQGETVELGLRRYRKRISRYLPKEKKNVGNSGTHSPLDDDHGSERPHQPGMGSGGRSVGASHDTAQDG